MRKPAGVFCHHGCEIAPPGEIGPFLRIAGMVVTFFVSVGITNIPPTLAPDGVVAA